MEISGRVRIPEYRLPLLLNDLKNLYGHAGSKEMEPDRVASVWKHTSIKSGAFKSKLASMRAYGLIEPKGEIRVTQIGEKIARRRNEEEYNQAIIHAIKNIPFWDFLYERYTNQDMELTSNQLKNDLETECDLVPKSAEERAPAVLKEYQEDIKAIRRDSHIKEETMTPAFAQEQTEVKHPDTKPPKGLLDYGYGQYKIFLPEDENEAKLVYARIRKMLDPLFGDN